MTSFKIFSHWQISLGMRGARCANRRCADGAPWAEGARVWRHRLHQARHRRHSSLCAGAARARSRGRLVFFSSFPNRNSDPSDYYCCVSICVGPRSRGSLVSKQASTHHFVLLRFFGCVRQMPCQCDVTATALSFKLYFIHDKIHHLIVKYII